MSSSHSTAGTPKSVFIAVCVVAASLWGLYLWKFRAEANAPRDSVALTEADADVSLMTLHAARRPADEPAPVPPTALVATTPGSSALRQDAELRGPSVAANEAVALGDGIAARLEPQLSPVTSGQDTLASPRVTASVDADVLAGRRALDRGQLVEARDHLNKALAGRLSMEQQETVRRDLARIADKLVFSHLASPGDSLARMHEIASGESLYVLAKRHKLTIEFLAKINRLERADMIRAGQRLKVVEGPFTAVVRKSQHRMDIFLQDQYVRSYRVGLGMDNGTPIGEWEVTTKQVNPAWTDPRDGQHYRPDDPTNPIGENWIGLDCVSGECIGRSGFGIHGTVEPESIGSDQSMGCVRLLPDDVAEVYDLLVSRHSIVKIVP